MPMWKEIESPTPSQVSAMVGLSGQSSVDFTATWVSYHESKTFRPNLSCPSQWDEPVLSPAWIGDLWVK